jgi:hypothetical protein
VEALDPTRDFAANPEAEKDRILTTSFSTSMDSSDNWILKKRGSISDSIKKSSSPSMRNSSISVLNRRTSMDLIGGGNQSGGLPIAVSPSRTTLAPLSATSGPIPRPEMRRRHSISDAHFSDPLGRPVMRLATIQQTPNVPALPISPLARIDKPEVENGSGSDEAEKGPVPLFARRHSLSEGAHHRAWLEPSTSLRSPLSGMIEEKKSIMENIGKDSTFQYISN